MKKSIHYFLRNPAD